ncbi:hypothetical protein FA13DRAFT_1817917 [Coprinellus micaceus]|uniref:CBS domain-containing protein n=1 Tax=Coprinellus micaceus TaxID=71717 RepID=A0A4Y7SS69_COPMI|nr:hypothetical protein FA13DRAFT_1817917 [Coprinellus micaceus]
MSDPAASSSSAQPQTPGDKYRGAVVEDLQLAPAFCLPFTESISRAIDLAYERDFSHIPVLDKSRKPLGYVDVAALKQKWEAGQASPGSRVFDRPSGHGQIVGGYRDVRLHLTLNEDKVSQYMTKFRRSSKEPYTLITPLTPLSDLEEFLKATVFALVTDGSRKFVLGVATSHDLENFVSRRGL